MQDGKNSVALGPWWREKNTQWILGGLVLILFIAALFVPPISLGSRVQDLSYTRINKDGGALATADGARVEFPAQGLATSTLVKLDEVSLNDFMNGNAGQTYRSAAKAVVVAKLTPKSALYTLRARGEAPRLAYIILPVPEDAGPGDTLDLYAWDAAAGSWRWLPSHYVAADHQVEALLTFMPANFMLMQSAAPAQAAIHVDLPADATLPTSLQTTITAVDAFGLSLSGEGAVSGSTVRTPPAGATYQVWPVLRNWDDDGVVRSDLAYNVITQKTWQDVNIEAISKVLSDNGYPGIVVAYRGVDPSLRADYVHYIRRLAQRLHKEKKLIAVRVESPRAISVDRWDTGGYSWRELGEAADFLEIPAPITPTAYSDNGTFVNLLRWSVGEVNRQKLIVVLQATSVEKAGNYFLPLAYSDTLTPLAGSIKLDSTGGIVAPDKTVDATLIGQRLTSPLHFDADLQQYSYMYTDKHGQTRQVWIEDATSLAHKLNLLRQFNIAATSVRSLTVYDVNPGTWNVLQLFAKGETLNAPVGKYALSWSVQQNGKLLHSGQSSLNRPLYRVQAPSTGDLVISASIVDSNGENVPVSTVAVMVATPVPSATATPTPTPTPEFAQLTVNSTVNVREGPSTNYRKIGVAKVGETYRIIGKDKKGTWWQIQFGDKPGWIIGKLSRSSGAVSAVEVAKNIPPEPTPSPRLVAAGRFGYGIQAHMVDNGQAPKVMEMTKRLGFGWVKQQVEWKRYESSRGHYDFGPLEPAVQAANNAGIKLLFSVVSAPNWARPGGDLSVGGPPNNPQDFANFMAALAKHYCGSSVKALEVWNEQNLHYEWGNQTIDPAAYMRLLKPTYLAIKRVCPSMIVISGALTPTGAPPPAAMDDFAYLAGMYRNGLRSYSDAIGAHPSGYNVAPWVRGGATACQFIREQHSSFTGPCDSLHHSWSFRSTMEGYRSIMLKYGDGGKRIWPTEFGWAAGGAFDNRYLYANDNTYAEQAAWTVKAYQMMRNWGFVGTAFLWNLNFRVVANGTEKAQWGIVGPNWDPLPAFNALAAMRK